MSLVDAGASATGLFWTRHNLSDHDDMLTTGAAHLERIVYNEAAGFNKWMNAAALGLPVFATTAGAGVGATIAGTASYPAPTDARGTLTITPAGTPATGTVATITLNKPMPAGVFPHVVLTAANAEAALKRLYVLSVSATVITIGATVVPVAGTAFIFTYDIQG